MNRSHGIPAVALIGFAAAITGCTSATPAARAATSRAELKDSGGRTVGWATLSESREGVRVVVEVSGLPAGEKGIHIHEVGRCEAPSFESAGGHFNPEGKQHGLRNPQGPHAGDLPNITVGADGRGRLDTSTRRVTLGAGPTSVFDSNGSTIVVHAAADDQSSDPSGNSGARLACGVIVKSP
jgi:superoxide dismutase, Cu-Zn family